MKMKRLILLTAIVTLAFHLNAQYSVGDKVSDFGLKGIDGKIFSMKDHPEAKGFIITFTCNTCPVAKKYEQRIIDLHSKYAPMGYPVVAINSNDLSQKPGDSMNEMKKRASEKGFEFAYLRDDDQSVAKKFGAERTPEIYLVVNNDEHFVLAYTGAIDNNPDSPEKADKFYVAGAIQNIMDGKAVEPAETRAIGCTIKWAQ